MTALADPRRDPIQAADVAIVFAHPDDETIGCGAQLPRLRGATLVCVTDGAPRDGDDARAHGFADARSYAQARRAELDRALAAAGAPACALLWLDVPDQEAAFHLAAIATRLAVLFRACAIRVALTHAYEGGHPDHDATAFAVHAATALLARRGQDVAIVEMPFYRLGSSGELRQSFAPEGNSPTVTTTLSERERVLKRRMMAAHATQRAVLSAFTLDAEAFRSAPAHDFGALPNGGMLAYERHPWGMTGSRWRECVHEATRALVLQRRGAEACA